MTDYIPSRGDICWLDFNPQKGTEQAKRRPALVLSADLFNTKGLAYVCPITTQKPRHGFHLKLPNELMTRGSVMTEQLKSLDWSARNIEYIEKVPVGFYTMVRAVIDQIL